MVGSMWSQVWLLEGEFHPQTVAQLLCAHCPHIAAVDPVPHARPGLVQLVSVVVISSRSSCPAERTLACQPTGRCYVWWEVCARARG